MYSLFPQKIPVARFLIFCGTLVSVITGCSVRDVKGIEETRAIDGQFAIVSPSEGVTPLDPAPPGQVCPVFEKYHWKVPAGWTERPPSPMRACNFALWASPDTECYISVLQGTAGGIAANVNRWRRQMAQHEFTAEEIAALPQIEVLGRPSPLIEIRGSFTGMNSKVYSDFMMLASIVTLTDQTVFIKMTGPESVVRAEKGHFIAFCESLTEVPGEIDAGNQES